MTGEVVAELLHATSSPVSRCSANRYAAGLQLFYRQERDDGVDSNGCNGLFMCVWYRAVDMVFHANTYFACELTRDGAGGGHLDRGSVLRGPTPETLSDPKISVELEHPQWGGEVHFFMTYLLVFLSVTYYLDLALFFYFVVFANLSGHGRQWEFGYCLLLVCLSELDTVKGMTLSTIWATVEGTEQKMNECYLQASCTW